MLVIRTLSEVNGIVIIISWSTVFRQAANAAMGLLFQQRLSTFSSITHNKSGTSTLTNRPFATEIMSLPILLPPDPARIPPCLASIILGLCE